MKRDRKFDAVIFDLDGTLLDTLKDLGDAMNRVLKAHGWPEHPESAYKKFVGNGATRLIERAVPGDARTPEVIKECLREFLDDYSQNWAVNTKPYPGIPELLEGLQGHQIIMSVLSNKIHDFTLMCVNRFLPSFTFAQVLGEREGIPKKPDPAGALEIVQETGIPAEKTLYVGDTAIDMQTARAAGMFAVGVLWGFRERDELEENGADALVERPEEIMGLIV